MKKREIWTISRLSKVPEAQCEILIEQNYEKSLEKTNKKGQMSS